MEPNQYNLEGFVFFIEATIVYIIDSLGHISLLNGNIEQIELIEEKNYYSITNLSFIKKDNNNLIYDMNTNTTFNVINGMTFFDKFAIVKFIALDKTFNNKDIKVKYFNGLSQEISSIKNKILFISLLNKGDSTYFLQKFRLMINNQENIYSFFIYKGQINSINLGLEEENIEKNKSYEIIYLSKKINNLPTIINISDYIIRDFDKFNCSNRTRFNIMNVKADRNIYNNYTELSSLEIIYLINEKNETIKYGVFDINSYQEEIRKDYIFDSDIEKFVNYFYNNYDDKKRDTEYAKEYYNSDYIDILEIFAFIYILIICKKMECGCIMNYIPH